MYFFHLRLSVSGIFWLNNYNKQSESALFPLIASGHEKCQQYHESFFIRETPKIHKALVI